MKRPKISFCISSAGRIGLLRRCITSIESQVYQNYEVLVGCPLDLPSFTKVKLLKTDNHIGKTRNLLKSNACGDWLVFLDEDVQLSDDKFINKFLNTMLNEKLDVYGGFYKTDSQSSIFDRAYNMTCNLWVLRGNLKGPYVLGGIYILKGSKFPDYFDGYSFGGEEYPYFSELIKQKCKINVSKSLEVIHSPNHTLKSFFQRAWLHGKFKPVDKIKGQRVKLFIKYNEKLRVKLFAGAYFVTVYISQFFNRRSLFSNNKEGLKFEGY